MRQQYFKHRTIFDFNNKTNDIGFPLPWKKGNEDNHFLFRLYKKDKTHYESVYFGETDHPIPWQTDHLNCWRKDAANAVEAFTKIVI